MTLAALVPNVRGAELALDAGVDELTVTISASATYNQRNVAHVDGRVGTVVGEIVALAEPRRSAVDAVVSCAFGSPYEGDHQCGRLSGMVRPAPRQAVAPRCTLADTTGMATPRRIADAIDEVGSDVGLHLHETRGTALLNAYTGLELGVSRFDTSVGGLGGSPFAHGAGGNLATEDLVALLDDCGVRTGIDSTRLVEAAALVESWSAGPVPSRVAHAGRDRGPSARAGRMVGTDALV